MTFKEVAMKNFTSHIRRYLAYFFCSCFTIMLFFIYTTILFNKSFMDTAKDKGYDSLVYMSIGAILVFSAFFITYAHGSFVKSRNGEFALFMTLGLTKKNLSRLIFIENTIILLVSMVVGLLSGTLFSRLFFLILSKLIGDAPIEYELKLLSFLVTFSIFLLIYAVAICMSRRAILKLCIVKLLIKKREGSHGKVSLVTSLLAITVFLGATAAMLILAHGKHFSDQMYLYLVYAVFAFPSMYYIISQGWSLYYHFRKRNKRSYYNHILSDNEMEYSFSGNKKILFVLSLLSAMIIFFVASPISLFSLSERLAEGERLSEVEYVEFGSTNTLAEGTLNQLLAQSETLLTESVDHEFLIMNTRSGDEELMKPVISETFYKEINKDAESVNKGEILVVSTAFMPGKTEFEGMDRIALYTGNIPTEFRVEGTVKGKAINRKCISSDITLVLSDADYNAIRSKVEADKIGIYHLLYFKNWRKTEPFIKALRESFEQPSTLYLVDTFLEAYVEVKNIYAMMIFFTSFMGGLFLIAAGSILIFKQYGDLSRLRELYQRLTKLGMTKKEFMRMQASIQKLIFFTPLILGTIVGFVYMYMTTFILGGGYMVGVFFRNSILVVILYFISQTIFYRCSLERLRKNITSCY